MFPREAVENFEHQGGSLLRQIAVGSSYRAGVVDAPNRRFGAGNGTRTRDFYLGKVALYQLSYSRPSIAVDCSRQAQSVKHAERSEPASA